MSSLDLVAHPFPFEVTSQHLDTFSNQRFPALLRMLLFAEAHNHDIPTDGIHVSDNIYTRDGGEDGRIQWTGEPERTNFLSGRLCQFQLKAGEIGPADAGNEVLASEGKVKCMIRSVLEQGGHYILLSTNPYTQE